MIPKYILDTHALIWYLEGNPKLSLRVKNIIDAAQSELILPIIALAEATLVIERKRCNIPTVTDLLTELFADSRIEIYPLTLPLLERSLKPDGLLIPEIHDRLIVSTGLYLEDLGHQVFILTRDEIITAAKVISTIW